MEIEDQLEGRIYKITWIVVSLHLSCIRKWRQCICFFPPIYANSMTQKYLWMKCYTASYINILCNFLTVWHLKRPEIRHSITRSSEWCRKSCAIPSKRKRLTLEFAGVFLITVILPFLCATSIPSDVSMFIADLFDFSLFDIYFG